MTEYGIHKPFMITFLWRWRNNCKVLEVRDEAYNSKMSIGENLENFITDIKNNHYKYENKGLESKDRQDSFHFTMLTPQEQRELKILDDEFLQTFLNENPDIPKTEMEKSDSNHKYVHSRGVRVNYII